MPTYRVEGQDEGEEPRTLDTGLTYYQALDVAEELADRMGLSWVDDNAWGNEISRVTVLQDPVVIPESEFHQVINALGRLAQQLDEEVYENAADTGLTEMPEFLTDLTARQRLVRRMERVCLELNSMADGQVGPEVQPIEYQD